VVSFGLAPAVMIKVMMDQSGFLQRAAWVLAAAYVAFAAMRLARYNVEKNESPGDRFSGLPSPAAAGAVVSLIFLHAEILINPARFRWLAGAQSLEFVAHCIRVALPMYALVVGVLMVTRVRYIHLAKTLLSGRKPFTHLVILALALVLAVLQLELTIAAGFTLYVAAGLVIELVASVRSRFGAESPAPRGKDGAPARSADG
jgi:CDP-diacylglycerol--serine O-phosphatidyltransferase